MSKFKPGTFEKNLSSTVFFSDKLTPLRWGCKTLHDHEDTEAAYQTKRSLCVFRVEMFDSRLRVDQL